MLNNCDDNKSIPFLLERDGIIHNVNDMFLRLTKFESYELNSKHLSVVWKRLFRINVDFNNINI